MSTITRRLPLLPGCVGWRSHIAIGLAVLSLSWFAGSPVHAQDQPPPAAPAPDAQALSPDPAPPSEAVPPAAPAPPPPSRRPAGGRRFPRVGLDLGAYLPASGKARDSFSSTWYSIGLGIGAPTRARSQGRFSLDLQTEFGSKDSRDYAFFAPVGIEYRRALIHTDPASAPSSIPYAGISGDYVATVTQSQRYDLHSGYRSAGGGSAFIGTTFGLSAYIEARYIYVSRVRGYDLSGTALTFGFRF